MITFRQKGDFSHLTKFLERAKEVVRLGDLDKYGRAGVAALASATPVLPCVIRNLVKNRLDSGVDVISPFYPATKSIRNWTN